MAKRPVLIMVNWIQRNGNIWRWWVDGGGGGVAGECIFLIDHENRISDWSINFITSII
jgi:hypothetical protein